MVILSVAPPRGSRCAHRVRMRAGSSLSFDRSSSSRTFWRGRLTPTVNPPQAWKDSVARLSLNITFISGFGNVGCKWNRATWPTSTTDLSAASTVRTIVTQSRPTCLKTAPSRKIGTVHVSNPVHNAYLADHHTCDHKKQP